MKKTKVDHIFDVFNLALLFVVVLVTLYPFLYVVFASLSSSTQFMAHDGILLGPVGFSLKSYAAVLRDPSIYIGYRNTIMYVVLGTAVNIFLTTLAAYVLSRRYLRLTKYIMILIIFTMYFSGGLIPSYLLMRNLHLDNTIFAVILPGAISTWNLLILKTAFGAIPPSLEEAARIDGAGEWRILFQIIVPVSVPTLMVMCLFYGVFHWNSWFNAMIYLRDVQLHPLQLFLRKILIQNDLKAMTGGAADASEANDIAVTIKYATIMVSTIPILVVYPFIQKHFVKGVLIGAVKE
ncbi:sugar ABC transporter permease [Spirochaetia bacterium]|nr:sugar ABC transporter permease [Spirochaetia bacterium]